MKKILLITYAAFLIVILASVGVFRSLYNRQISSMSELLNRQVQIVGLAIDSTDNGFLTDLKEVMYPEDLDSFFSGEQGQIRMRENMELFYSKYQNFITGIKIYDKNRNEFTLKKDEAINNWLRQTFILHVQGDIVAREQLVPQGSFYDYYLPVVKDDQVTGNIVVSVDYNRYFNHLFSTYNLKDYQWQWVISDSGKVIFNNNRDALEYSGIQKIISALDRGSPGNLIHKASANGKSQQIISAFYPARLLNRNMELVFSSPTDIIQKNIALNVLLIAVLTLAILQVIVTLFRKHSEKQKAEIERLTASEKMLFRLIEEMPVGVIIHNRSREIIKANRVAASQYSYQSPDDMVGKLFPEISLSTNSEYFSKNLGGNFRPDQFVILKKVIGEVVLFRNSIPVNFLGEEANMELLIDVTTLESARKQEAEANTAKSEFLARMSYEIRTPLNGIIGITDLLSHHDLKGEMKDLVSLLRRSSEVLQNIVTDILDFSRIETGKMILDELPFNFREEFSFCIDLASTYLEDKEVRLSATVGEEVPEEIIGDPFRLRQVITNLLNYSISNTAAGEIQLFCRVREVNNGVITLEFELKDTGRNYEKTALKKIFGEFVSSGAGPVAGHPGPWSGTVLARQLIELMGGELTAESPSGLDDEHGVRIVFSIITWSSDKQIKDLEPEKVLSFSQIKTLVITSNQNRDELVLNSLHKIGLTLSVTTFHKSTINQIRAGFDDPSVRYRLVIIMNEKDFDGFEVARNLWESGLSEQLLIIMISSYDERGNFVRCITTGVDNYIVKPFDSAELMKAIQSGYPFVESGDLAIDTLDLRTEISILVIEDNKMNQKVISSLLASLGYSCDLADDGLSGFIQAKTKKYDIIFMDLIMPGMDGFESTRKIMEHDRTNLIVAFSADNMPDSQRKARMSGIREFIPKPVRMEDIKLLFARYFTRN